MSLADRSQDFRVRQAYSAWKGQRLRARQLGFTVEYSSKEFIEWWIENLDKREWKSPTTGRIDHSKGYSFDNIEMQERSDNTAEVHRRLGNMGGVKPRAVWYRGPDRVAVFSSTRLAARSLGIYQSYVVRRCQVSEEMGYVCP